MKKTLIIVTLVIWDSSSLVKIIAAEVSLKSKRKSNWAQEIDQFTARPKSPLNLQFRADNITTKSIKKNTRESIEAQELAAIESDEGIKEAVDPARRIEIKNILKNNSEVFSQCISTNRPNKKDGQITIYFNVNPSGQVQRVGLGVSKLKMADKACLIQAVYGLIFPPTSVPTSLKIQQPILY